MLEVDRVFVSRMELKHSERWKNNSLGQVVYIKISRWLGRLTAASREVDA
jgi:hypothetical protein